MTDEEWQAYDRRMEGYDRRSRRLFYVQVTIGILVIILNLGVLYFNLR